MFFLNRAHVVCYVTTRADLVSIPMKDTIHIKNMN